MQSAREFYEMLDESQWWPADQLDSLATEPFAVCSSPTRVQPLPFYKFRLNRFSGRPAAIDWDRWHEIPILTRADVMMHFDSLLSRAPIPDHGPFQDVQSSGSTGHPVTTRATRWLMDMVSACNWRTQHWMGLDWSKTLVTTIGAGGSRSRLATISVHGAHPGWPRVGADGCSTHTTTPTSHERLQLMADTRRAYHCNLSFVGRRDRENGAETCTRKFGSR